MAQTNDQKRIAKLEKGLAALSNDVEKILNLLSDRSNNSREVVSPRCPVFSVDIKTKKSDDTFAPILETLEIGDIGKFTKLPTLFIKEESEKILFSIEEKDGFEKVEPQLVSTYKNSLTDDFEAKSVKGVAPNFHGFSFNNAKRLFNRYGGKHLSWRTYLVYALLVLVSDRKNEVLGMTRAEDYNWSDSRECGFTDTHDNFYVGISQLFTTGYTMVDCEHTDEEAKLYNTFLKLVNKDSLISNTNRYFLFLGDYGSCNNPLLRAVGNVFFGDGWGGFGCARLCLPCEGVVKGSPLNEVEKE